MPPGTLEFGCFSTCWCKCVIRFDIKDICCRLRCMHILYICSSDTRWMDDTNVCVTSAHRGGLPLLEGLKSGLEHTARSVNPRSYFESRKQNQTHVKQIDSDIFRREAKTPWRTGGRFPACFAYHEICVLGIRL